METATREDTIRGNLAWIQSMGYAHCEAEPVLADCHVCGQEHPCDAIQVTNDSGNAAQQTVCQDCQIIHHYDDWSVIDGAIY